MQEVNGIEIKCAYSELVPIEKIVEHPRNRNRHPIEQLERLAKIIKHTGWRHALTVSKKSGFITTGHGRKQVAEILGMEKIPVDYQDYENEAEEYQHVIADNEIARWSELDVHGAITDIEELGLIENDFDLDLLGLKFDISSIGDEVSDKNLDDVESEKKYLIEVSFKNDMERQDLYDDLISKGFAVKIK